MLTVTAFVVATFLTSGVHSLDRDSDNACIDKPCGPFICQARCVASCLDTGTSTSVSECAETLCNDFDDNKPCALTDTACWKNCGLNPSPDDTPAPSLIDDMHLGTPERNANPKIFKVEWPSTKDASLYIVEAFPIFEANANGSNKNIFKNMTTDTSFTIERADPCESYMIRVMAVNGFGISSPRYLVVDAWKPEMHFDENFDVRSIRREGEILKVLIDYTPPDNWKGENVELENSFVRAHECLGPIREDVFLSSQQDEDGYYTPMVFVNETENNIELSFPIKIMQAKCLFSYRISALRTRCNVTTTLETKGVGVGVDFSLNCMSVENSDCQTSSEPEATIDTDSTDAAASNSSSIAQGGEVVIVADPEAMKELQMESSSIVNTTPNPSKETDEEQGKENENEPTTTSSSTADSDNEAVVVANPDAMKELENERSSIATTTPGVADTTNPQPDSSEDKPMEKNIPSPPSPLETGDTDGDAEAQAPIIIIVEPRDPTAPLCKMADFDADVETRTISTDDNSEERSVDLTLSWLEKQPSDVAAPRPSEFVIRYGQVTRTLIVEAQPEIVDATVLRTSQTDSSEEISRTMKISGLTPGGLYAFQICAIYKTSSDSPIPWDTAPRRIIDLSAVDNNLSPSATPPPDAFDNALQNGTFSFMDAFIDALNTSFDNAQETADALASTTADPRGQASSLESSENPDDVEMGLVEINLPQQQPTILNIDVKPVVIGDSSSWYSGRALWLITALALLAITVSAFAFLVLKRSRNRRGQWQKQQQFQPTTLSPIYTQNPPSDVKIPIS